MPRAARRGRKQRQWRCTNKGGIFSFRRKRISPLKSPKRKDEGPSPSTLHIGSLDLEELHALRNVSAVYMASP